ncbi:hypothetical protein D3Z51_07510 [Clostridiaceae bacterium]|nr:hypothetical protein [Clostridiaceae bacterium]RKI14976.1 hypothetical protein D7V81_07000 [bacterium 1XD21-70]
MKQDFRNVLGQACNAAILAGCIILFLGLYYCIIKAGIPYQDPPLELQIKYAIHMGIGDILTKTGAIIIFFSGGARLLLAKLLKDASHDI